MQKPLILITNDDGISSKGIRILINIAKEFGDILIVAPDSAQSGKSHSITQEKPISFNLIKKEKGYEEYACSGTPADAVKIAVHEISKHRKIDLVLSGINHGTNTSVSVLYSGTMGAAIEGSLNGIASAGFSLDDYDKDANFSQTEPFIKQVIKEILQNGLPQNISLNINFPKFSEQEIKGFKLVRGTRGTWEEKFYSAHNPHGMNAFWMSGTFRDFEPQSTDTDLFALSQNYASITPIKADFNACEQIEKMKPRFES